MLLDAYGAGSWPVGGPGLDDVFAPAPPPSDRNVAINGTVRGQRRPDSGTAVSAPSVVDAHFTKLRPIVARKRNVS